MTDEAVSSWRYSDKTWLTLFYAFIPGSTYTSAFSRIASEWLNWWEFNYVIQSQTPKCSTLLTMTLWYQVCTKIQDDWFPLLDLLALVFNPNNKFHVYNSRWGVVSIQSCNTFIIMRSHHCQSYLTIFIVKFNAITIFIELQPGMWTWSGCCWWRAVCCSGGFKVPIDRYRLPQKDCAPKFCSKGCQKAGW